MDHSHLQQYVVAHNYLSSYYGVFITVSKIHNYQHRFQQGYSAELNLSLLLKIFYIYAMDHRLQTDVILLLLDFQKACDTVPHLLLLSKLLSQSIQNQTYSWIIYWLTGHS